MLCGLSMTTSSRGRPEDRARTGIDSLLNAAGWIIQNRDSINIEAGRGVAIREFLLAPGYGFADYLLYVDGYAAGVVEAKKAGVPLTEVELSDGPIQRRPPYRPSRSAPPPALLLPAHRCGNPIHQPAGTRRPQPAGFWFPSPRNPRWATRSRPEIRRLGPP